MRISIVLSVVISATGCRIGEYIAEPPIDAGGGGGEVDGGDPDAADCAAGDDGDGDGVDDCTEAADGDAWTDPAVYNGLHATIGDRPEVTGSCDALDDHAEMVDRFDPGMQAQDVRAGWAFDTGADSYDDPTYGFTPNWPSAASGRFSVRYAGNMFLTAGPHCFSIDIGATGTGIIDGKNMCAQLYVGVGGTPTAPLAETGYLAATAGVATGCITAPSDGGYTLDIAYWYFNIFEQSKLAVRHCAGAACTPDEPIGAGMVQAP